MTPVLTPAQRRALEWLPSDGGWRNKAGKDRAIVLDSLWLRFQNSLVEWKFGPRGGADRHFRITPAGIALKAEMEADRG